MESSGKTRRLNGGLLLAVLLALTGWAAQAQLGSDAARVLAAKENKTLYVAVLTKPAMVAAYNPAERKAELTTVKRRKTPKNADEDAKNLLAAAGVKTKQIRYYIPKNLSRENFWNDFKQKLSAWRNTPFAAAGTLWSYLSAYHDRRTNISPAEFLLWALDLSRLEITDFTVRNAGAEAPAKKRSEDKRPAADAVLPPVQDRAPLIVQDTLLVEVLNASGKKGAALELTQFLRDQNQKGLLNVDVLQYDNFPGERQKKTRIINYSGRLSQLKQLSTAIGVNSEIESEKKGNAICDARVIIGEDFKQPI